MSTQKRSDKEKQRAKPVRKKRSAAHKLSSKTPSTDFFELIDLGQSEDKASCGSPSDALIHERSGINSPIPDDGLKRISEKQAAKEQAEWEREHPFRPHYVVLGADNPSLSLTDMKSWKSLERWKIWQAALVLHGIDPKNVDLEFEIEHVRQDDGVVTFEWLFAQRIPETNAVCRTYIVLLQAVELETAPLRSPTGVEMVSTREILAIAKQQKLGSTSVIKFLECSPNEETSRSVPLRPGEETTSVTKAAGIVMEENRSRYSLGTAKTMISRACDGGEIRSEGHHKARKVSLEGVKKLSAQLYEELEGGR